MEGEGEQIKVRGGTPHGVGGGGTPYPPPPQKFPEGVVGSQGDPSLGELREVGLLMGRGGSDRPGNEVQVRRGFLEEIHPA